MTFNHRLTCSSVLYLWLELASIILNNDKRFTALHYQSTVS